MPRLGSDAAFVAARNAILLFTDKFLVSSEIASFQYDAASRITGITQQLWTQSTVTSGTTTTTQLTQLPVAWQAGYDSRSRLLSFARTGASSSYTYDANGNRTSAQETTSAALDLEGQFSQAGQGQSLSQMLNTEASSNRLLGFTQTVAQTQNNQTVSSQSSNVSYTLDAAGNLTSDGLRTFQYDAANRLTKVELMKDGEAASVSYLHNALGQRVFKSQVQAAQTLPSQSTLDSGFINWLRKNFGWMFQKNGSTTSLGQAFVYGDGEIPSWALLGEYDNGTASGKGRTEYIWLPTDDGAIPIGMYRNGKLYAIHTDHLGTPRLITDSGNQPVWQWPYSAFGNNKPTGILQTSTDASGNTVTQATKPAVEVDMRLPGQMQDAEAALADNLMREYDSGKGRYRQPDPVGLNGGFNRFAYVSSSPLTSIDPFGLAQIVEPEFRTFADQMRWRKKYKDLYSTNEMMREYIKKKCPKLLSDFDKWLIYPDPKMDTLRRDRDTYAKTYYSDQGPSTTQFNWGFFNAGSSDPSQEMIFAHEFRHTMRSNHDLFRPGDLLRDPSTVPGETDADQWAANFWKGKCECDK